MISPTQRGPDPADAQHRVRRDERDPGRPLRRHRRQALAGPVVPVRPRAFLEPLQRHQDILAGKHGNTQVPKIIGSPTAIAYTGSPRDILAAGFFWDRVVEHHSFATGGHGNDEYFGEPDHLSDRVDGRTAETCNVYNMLKLTRRLFALRPDPHYADFHERALFNHILGSIDPEDGRTCYMVPVGRGVQHEYSEHARGLHLLRRVRHGEPRPARRRDLLRVGGPALGEPLRAVHGRVEGGRGIRDVDTRFPGGRVGDDQPDAQGPEAHPGPPKPAWAGEGFAVKVNGEAVDDQPGRPTSS